MPHRSYDLELSPFDLLT